MAGQQLRRRFRFLHSFNSQLFMSHLLVAIATSVILLVLTMAIPLLSGQPLGEEVLVASAQQLIVDWQRGTPSDEAWLPSGEDSPAFGLIVAPDGTVRYHRGKTRCTVSAALAGCAPTLQNRAPGVRYLSQGDNPPRARANSQWVEVVETLADGSYVLAHLPATRVEETRLSVVGLIINGFWPSLLVFTLVVTTITIPPALLLTWLWSRPIARRIAAMTETSRRFAAGDLSARSQDTHDDEVGQLARQLDDMAATLAQNIGVLRDLAQQNAALMRQNEEGAIQAERLRLARDLHDELSHQLFRLNLQAAALPEQISRDPKQAVIQAQVVAALAEQAQMDLRTILLELRPTQLARQGLNETLQELCRQWKAIHHLPVDLEVVLSGRYLLAGVEDVIFRVTREALANVAKHAGATSVSVALVEGRQLITLSVTDDGRGFDPQQVAAQGHYGLAGMRERAAALGGTLAIESDTNRGTTVRLTLPLAPHGEDSVKATGKENIAAATIVNGDKAGLHSLAEVLPSKEEKP
jgi:NarL family two-component system sensor histidine kinase LiaS